MSAKSVVAIIADGEIDQIIDYDPDILRREELDLKDIGCEVRVRYFDTWEEAEAWQDAVEER